jgi:hypothetical protein
MLAQKAYSVISFSYCPEINIAHAITVPSLM